MATVRVVQNACQHSAFSSGHRPTVDHAPHVHARGHRSGQMRTTRLGTLEPCQSAKVHSPAGAAHPCLSRSPLAVYPFPDVRNCDKHLFARAVRNLVGHLPATSDRRIQFSKSRGGERHRVQACSQSLRWPDVQAMSVRELSELVLYVQPVDSHAAVQCGHVCNETTCSHSHQPPSPGVPEWVGKLGQCAESHDDAAASQVLQSYDMDEDEVYLAKNGLSVQYYGVMAHSFVNPMLNGCFLLKTVMHMEDQGCSCMHYSAMRVCRGLSLVEQESNRWLLHKQPR